jgi:hypothetical protein
MDASFNALFKRACYYRSATKKKRRKEECERFAVASLAFCIKHDNVFAIEFLRCASDFSLQPSVNLDIEIEPRRNGPDLLIRSLEQQVCIVIEAKIWAPVEDTQDYTKEAFKGEKPLGYGHWITTDPLTSGHPEVIYLLLVAANQRDPRSLAFDGRKIHCRSLRWQDLPYSASCTRLPADLRRCLADFGVPGLASERTQGMKINAHVREGAKAWEVVTSTCEELDFSVEKLRPDISYEKLDVWCFGWYLEPPSQARHKKGLHGQLDKLLGGGIDGMLVWQGFEEAQPDGAAIAVWIHCKTEAKADAVEKMIQSRGAGWTVKREPYCDEGFKRIVHVSQSIENSGKTDPVEWFLALYRAIGIDSHKV